MASYAFCLSLVHESLYWFQRSHRIRDSNITHYHTMKVCHSELNVCYTFKGTNFKTKVTDKVKDFSHLLSGFKNSTTFILKPYLVISLFRWGVRPAEVTSLFEFFLVPTAHWRLLLATISQSLLITDVGWGAFLIKRQMSGGGILTVWHYKSWHCFKILCFAMLSHAPERKKSVQSATQPSQTPHIDGLDYHHLPHNFCSHICAA